MKVNAISSGQFSSVLWDSARTPGVTCTCTLTFVAQGQMSIDSTITLAFAQGGWKSSAHSRYDRFAMSQVVRIPSVIAGVDDGDDSAPTNEAEERAAGPPTRRLRRDSLRSLVSQAYDDDGDDDDDDDEEEAEPEAEVAGSDDTESVRSGEAASPLVHLTPAGAMAQPGGFWGQGSTRLGPRARSPTSHSRARRSPSSS